MICFRPLIVVAGASDANQEGMGAFQEWPQVESCRLYTKFTARPDCPERIPFYVEKVRSISLSADNNSEMPWFR